jgi:hypothetical protein
MKYYILLLFVVFALLSGCSEQRRAKAYELNSATNRKNDLHDSQMADRAALQPVRLAVVEVAMWSLMVGGVFIIGAVSIGGSWYIFGSVRNHLEKQKIIRIPLNPETRQFDFIIYNHGRRALDPNTGQRFLLSETSGPDRQLVEGSHAVQLAGASENRIIDGNIKVLN